jgi:hypothetical protein
LASLVGLEPATSDFAHRRRNLRSPEPLLGIRFLATAGFGRWLYEPSHAMLGDGGFPFLVEFFGGTNLLVLA